MEWRWDCLLNDDGELELLVYWTGTVLVVSRTTGGGGVTAIYSDVTHYFPTSSKLLLI